MAAISQKQIDSFALSIHPITRADVPNLHQLSVSVGWMHRPEDWEFVLDLGEGVFAADEIGRIAGSAMLYPITPGYSALGMVIIAPRLIENGTSHWLIEQMLARTNGADLIVSATTESYPVYIAHGFQAGRLVYQYQGHNRQMPSVAADVLAKSRPLCPEDVVAVKALDLKAYPVDRGHILDRLLTISDARVIEENGQITGYALCRPFGRGQVIGPIVALNDEDAIALCAPLVKAHQGSFLRVDTRSEMGAFRAFLQASGLRLHDTVISMTRGAVHNAPGPHQIYGLVNQALL